MSEPRLASLVRADALAELAVRATFTVRASAGWPLSEEDTLPPLPGFIESSFSPLVAEAAERCLRAAYGEPPVPGPRGDRTAMIICSEHGDAASARRVATTVAAGGRVGPLMFFQAVPNAVAGHVTARWQLAGPVACLGSARAGIDAAYLLIAAGEADEVLIVHAEQSPVDRAEAVLVILEPT